MPLYCTYAIYPAPFAHSSPNVKVPSNKARLNAAPYVRREVKRVNTLDYEIRMVLRRYLATTQEFHCWAEDPGTRIHLEYDTALKLCRLDSE